MGTMAITYVVPSAAGVTTVIQGRPAKCLRPTPPARSTLWLAPSSDVRQSDKAADPRRCSGY
jgi:hypothetical protein